LENVERQETCFIRVSRLQSIKTKIIVFALVATIIPSVALGVLSFIQNRNILREKIANELHSAATQAAGELDLWIKARLYDLKVFSSSYVISENLQRILKSDRKNIEHLVATNRIKAYLQSVQEKFTDYQELLLASMIGDPLVTSGPGTSALHLPAKWIEQLEKGRPIIGAAYWDPELKRQVITLAELIKSSDNRPLGILAAKIDLAAIMTILKKHAVRDIVEIFLIDRQGKPMVSSKAVLDHSMPLHAAPSIPTAGAGATGSVIESIGFRQQPVVGVSAGVPATDLTIVAEMEKADAYADILRLRTLTITLVSVLLLAMGILAYFLGHSIVRPLKRLSDNAGQVAAGDLHVKVPVRGASEVSYLSQVFNHMVASLQRSRMEISEAQEALMEKNRELHHLSVTDGLTGLFNRKHLMDLLEMELARNQRYQAPFSVMIADIDHFKRINDTYGHLAGDAVLRRIADTLRKTVRECDHVGRYGGEEFLIILPNSDAVGAVEMAQRIREQISQVSFYNDGNEISMTVSVGVAQCAEDEDRTEALISRADAALYQAKDNGRNRVIGP
jgi:diguanylate cyclase (GGDEF)-like protein